MSLNGWSASCASRAVMTLLLLGLLPGVAAAQGFMVRPMSIDFSPRPGDTVARELYLRNTRTGGPLTLLIRVAAVTHTEGGTWQAVELDDPNSDMAATRTCATWLDLEATEVDLQPSKEQAVTLTVRAPSGVRGDYAAALIVQSKPPAERPHTIGLVIQMVVSINVSIRGPRATQRIDFSEAAMEFIEAGERNAATTFVSVGVSNTGETRGVVSGEISVLRQAGEDWRRVMTAEIEGRRLIPGSQVRLATDLQRRLPSGTYRLKGPMRVDGRTKAQIDQVVEFEGDPTVTTVAADVTLQVEPASIELEGVPGGRRSLMVRVTSPSADALKVGCGVIIPKALGSAMMGDVKSEDFSCHEWFAVSPQGFDLRAAGQRNIKLTYQIPEDAGRFPWYYADLIIAAGYEDGGSAGRTVVPIVLRNTTAELAPLAQVISMKIVQEEGDRYALSAKFGNFGNTHFMPVAQGRVTTMIGSLVASCELHRPDGVVLPLGTPEFSGVLDFSEAPPGNYLLRAEMDYGGEGAAMKEVPIKVALEGDGKVVTVIETAGVNVEE